MVRRLRRYGAEIVALQEVVMPIGGAAGGLSSLAALVADSTFAQIVVPPHPRKRTADRGCVILTTDRFALLSRGRRIPRTPSPERSCVVDVVDTADPKRGTMTVASVHWVPGSDTTEKATGARWGPKPKRKNFRAVARWMAGQRARTIVGVDSNSPQVDHPILPRSSTTSSASAGSPSTKRSACSTTPTRCGIRFGRFISTRFATSIAR